MYRLPLVLIFLAAFGCDTTQPQATPRSPQTSAENASGMTVASSSEESMPTTFDSLYAEFVIASFDKQLRLADIHGKDAWGFNMTNGKITFNESVAYKVQILGTEDHVNESWMWGWGNKASNIPEEMLAVGNELHAYGEKHSISQLTTAKSPLEEVDGHTVGLIASGFANAKAYYRCPYENGALFVLITDANLELPIENKIVRATRVIPECISALEIADQRAATIAYLRQNGFEVDADAGRLVVHGDGGPLLTAEFDELNRLTSLNSHIVPRDGS